MTTEAQSLPRIIQGGMGVAISSWKLANTVSKLGHLGVVSGTGVALVLIGRLMDGDEGGHVRRALAAFPVKDVAQKIIDKYYIEGGKSATTPYKRATLWSVNPPRDLNQITVVANFVEVWLAKEGHNNSVGINLLEKVQLPNLASMYGAMLAGVDYVIMGAGIPMQVPGALDEMSQHKPFSYRLDVIGAEEDVFITFDPEDVFPGIADLVGPLKRPNFLPIVSSWILANALKKRANGEIQGYVIEMPTAGGHNAPPRVAAFNERGEPIYGEKDAIDLEKFRKMDMPFWLAGGYGNAEKMKEALEEGASGVQVGTAFAYCNESGMDQKLREQVIDMVLNGEIDVVTSATASPTGFPFKVVQVSGSTSDDDVYQARERICDVGFLRQLYAEEDGKVNYRCPAAPIDGYLKKGGKLEDTEGRMCLCNHLGAAAGFSQYKKNGMMEPPVVTSGDDLPNIKQFMKDGKKTYSAAEVIEMMMQGIPEQQATF